MRTAKALFRVALLAALLAPVAGAAADYVVVVHPSSGFSSISSDDLQRIFTRASTVLPGGETARPVEPPKASAARIAFTRTILKSTVPAMDLFWTRSVFSGRAVPPPERKSDAEVVAYVRENPGAIGYVAAGAATEGVKKVSVTD